MGIVVNPPQEVCEEVPERIYARFSGIQRGSSWYEGLPEPPNGLYILTRPPGQSYWFRDDGSGYGPGLWPDGGQWRVDFSAPDLSMFYALGSWPGDRTWRSTQPADMYYTGGVAVLSWRGCPDYPGPLEEGVELVGPLPEEKVFAEPFAAVEGSGYTVRYAKVGDGTSIYVQKEG